jgi:hypothetical protein
MLEYSILGVSVVLCLAWLQAQSLAQTDHVKALIKSMSGVQLGKLKA